METSDTTNAAGTPCKCCDGSGVQVRSDLIKIQCPACGGSGKWQLNAPYTPYMPYVPDYPYLPPVRPWWPRDPYEITCEPWTHSEMIEHTTV